jgi:hypothetical protein
MTLPDDVTVYPARAGSACGKNMSKETTIGNQKETIML